MMLLQENLENFNQILMLSHLYDSLDEMNITQKNDAPQENQLPARIESHHSLSQIYAYLNEVIYNFKLNPEKKYKEITQWKQRSFYLLKSKLFYGYYSGNRAVGSQATQNVHIFQISNLQLLFVQILEIRDKIKPLIYKLYGEESRGLKIEGYFLIASIESLLKEIINAAFPYELYQEGSIIVLNEKIQLTPNQIGLIQKQKESKGNFRFDQIQSLKNSLLQIDDSIDSLKMRQKKSGVNKQQNRFGQISLENNLQSLQFIRFKHQIFLFVNKHTHIQTLKTIQSIQKFIQEEPTKNIKPSQSVTDRTKWLKLNNYFLYWKSLIEIFSKLDKEKQEIYTSCLLKMIHIVQNWIELYKDQKGQFILVENYIALLRNYHKYNQRYIKDQSSKLLKIFQPYINNIIISLIQQNQYLMNKIISTDQQFTFSILTSKQIIKTLVNFQDRFAELIKNLAPLLQSLLQLTSIQQSKKASRQTFIEMIISKINYPSQRNERIKSKAKLFNVISQIDDLLKFDHKQIKNIKPHLKEMKSTLILLAIMKKKSHSKGNQSAQEYLKLKEISLYFYTQRLKCPIYELKSKILLYIVLFIMGFRHPTIKQGEKTVNLRIRIINLYNRLYSQNVETLMMSLLQSVQSPSQSQQEEDDSSPMFYLIDPKNNIISYGQQHLTQQQICGSQELQNNIHNFIATQFVNDNENAKEYLINLMKTLNKELFIFEENSQYIQRKDLVKDYSNFLKKSLGVDKHTNDVNILKILQIQSEFFLRRYQKAWNLFISHKQKQQSFSKFLEEIHNSYYNTSLLKFVAIYNILQKMDHLFFNNKQKQQNISEMLEKINDTNDNIFQREAIECLYELKQKKKKLTELEKFYHNKLASNMIGEKYEQIQSQLAALNIKVYKFQHNQKSKKSLKIVVSQQHGKHYSKICEESIKYYLFNQAGIYKINQVKLGSQLVIIVQSNPYELKNQINVFQTHANVYQQNAFEKFSRKSLQTIIQSLQTFYNSQSSPSLLSQQIDIDYHSDILSFCINPFYGLILSIVKPNASHELYNNKYINNRSIIQKLFKELTYQFSQPFRNNFNYFLYCLTTMPAQKIQYTKLLQIPIFMKLQQKQMFLVSFNDKMEKMCEKVHKDEEKLIKKKDYSEAQRKRLFGLKDSIYKSYSYHFLIGGVIETQMNIAKICSQKESNIFDWITEHKHLIEYDLPKKPNSKQIKQSTYSLSYFLKYLKGVITTKRQGGGSVISTIQGQFPKLIDFLYSKKNLLQTKFQEIMTGKNEWLIEYFNLSQSQLTRLNLMLNKKSKDQGFSADIQEAFQVLACHKSKYQTHIFVKLKQKKYNCSKCYDLLSFLKKYPSFFDFLTKLRFEAMKKSNFLSLDHYPRQCFLTENFANHRALSILGSWVRKLEAKYYIILNWWFYLQTEFPLLIQSLEKIRHLII